MDNPSSKISGRIDYFFATPTLAYALVESRELFDAFPLPLSGASNDDVLIKTMELNGVDMIYQHWLNSKVVRV